MRYREKKLFTIVWLLLCMLISACSGKNAEDNVEIQIQTENTAEEPVSLEVYAWQDEEDNLRLLADAYMEKKPEIKVHVNFVPISEYSQKMMSLRSGKKQADCILSPNTAEAVVWQNKGMLKNLDEWTDKEEMADHYDIWYQEGEERCSSYMLPYRMSRWGVYYNKKLFDEKGVAYPDEDWTWEEYARTAVLLTNQVGLHKTYGSLSFEPTSIWWRVPARTQGANNPLVKEDLEAFRKSAQWCYQLTYDLKAQLPYTEQTGNLGIKYNANFLEGNIGMYFCGDWAVADLNRTIEAEKLDFDYDIAPLPHWEGETYHVLSDAAVISMVEFTEHPEEAYDFVRFVSGPEGARVLAENNMIPAWKSEEIQKIYLSSLKYPEHAQYFFKEGEVSRVPASGAYNEAMEIVKEEVASYLLQEQSLEQCFHNIEEALKTLSVQ